MRPSGFRPRFHEEKRLSPRQFSASSRRTRVTARAPRGSTARSTQISDGPISSSRRSGASMTISFHSGQPKTKRQILLFDPSALHGYACRRAASESLPRAELRWSRDQDDSPAKPDRRWQARSPASRAIHPIMSADRPAWLGAPAYRQACPPPKILRFHQGSGTPLDSLPSRRQFQNYHDSSKQRHANLFQRRHSRAR